jgi:hypothetical protein
MKRGLLLAVVMCSGTGPGTAQRVDAGASVGIGTDSWRADAHLQAARSFGPRLSVGGGLRLTRYGGESREFRNQDAPTDGLPGSLVLDPEVWGLNVMVAAELRLTTLLSAGANLDLVGVAWGPERRNASASVTPARGSMFRYGNADRGSLNSEFFLVARIRPRLALRGGLSHYVVGYAATAGAESGRYLRFDNAVFVALRWSLSSPRSAP